MRVSCVRYLLVLLALSIPVPSFCQRRSDKRSSAAQRSTNWTALLSQPSAFITKAHSRLKKREGGYNPSPACDANVGPGYLEALRRTRYRVCGLATYKAPITTHDVSILCTKPTSCRSFVDCYTAPQLARSGGGNGSGNAKSVSRPSVALCKSQNLLLSSSCKFLSGDRPGALSKKFPLPDRGSVKLACPLVKLATSVKPGGKTEWLRNIHHDVWWANATEDHQAVFKACAPNATYLVTTPTLFLLRDRHANYPHDLEALSATFALLAALEPQDVAAHGLQVVITDRAPATGFLETWARLSGAHRLRVLAEEPFPPNTCFRSAFHVYAFAGGPAYNTNPAAAECGESPLLTGLSNWLRQLYGEGDPAGRAPLAAPSAAAVAGPAAEAAGVRGLRPAAGGIVLKNVVWLSRRNLEVVRLLLNESRGWKAMRMVRNEDEVVAGILAAVQEWNAESCLLRRFDRTVKSEYELSLKVVNPIHTAAATAMVRQLDAGAQQQQGQAAASSAAAAASSGRRRRGRRRSTRSLLVQLSKSEWGEYTDGYDNDYGEEAEGDGELDAEEDYGEGAYEYDSRDEQEQREDEGEEEQREVSSGLEGRQGQRQEQQVQEEEAAGGSATSFVTSSSSPWWFQNRRRRRRTLAAAADNVNVDEDDAEEETEEEDGGEAAGGGAGNGTGSQQQHSYMIGNNVVALEKLWALDAATQDGCRRTNVLFKFVVGDFNDMSYTQQLQTIFRTGVLAGVHGSGLAHGFFMAPGQSAVLQLLGKSYAKAPATRMFRNMARGLGHYYEDVPYGDVDVDVQQLKAAVKRSMDFVARKAMDAQMRRSGALRLVLVDQSHFSIVVPSLRQCPANGSTTTTAAAGVAPLQRTPSG